jgi:hypothetical protein
MWESLAKQMHVVGLDEIHGQEHLTEGVEGREGLQKVGLRPENPDW